jgi:putative DNA primase/helicase
MESRNGSNSLSVHFIRNVQFELIEIDNDSAKLGELRDTELLPEPIPDLRSVSGWIVWRSLIRPGAAKPDKVPCNPSTGRLASVTSPKTGKSFEVATRAMGRGRFNGLGIILQPPLVGIDLDSCRDPITGRLDRYALEMVDKFKSYTEVSPSGRGLHIFVQGVSPGSLKTHKLEMYSERRYFTYTGRHLMGTPATIEQRTREIVDLYWELKPAQREKRAIRAVAEVPLRPVPDDKLMERLPPSARRLYRGDWTGYESQSEADLAFCAYLTFVTRSAEEIDRLFRSSGLMRSKWDKLYGKLTVKQALRTMGSSNSSRVFRTSLPLDDSLATEHGVSGKLSPREWATWRTRMLIEEGTLPRPKVDLLPLPTDVPPRVVKAHEGFRLLLECSWSQFPDEPVMFSVAFASRWCHLAHRHAYSAIQWLVQNDYIRGVGMDTAHPLRPTPLYLPGKGNIDAFKPSWLKGSRR